MILVIAFLSVIVFLVLGISIPLTFLGAAAIIYIVRAPIRCFYCRMEEAK